MLDRTKRSNVIVRLPHKFRDFALTFVGFALSFPELTSTSLELVLIFSVLALSFLWLALNFFNFAFNFLSSPLNRCCCRAFRLHILGSSTLLLFCLYCFENNCVDQSRKPEE